MSSAGIVVVGAGAAGLTAARTLARAGRRVLLLEARARIGGRLLTQAHAPGAAPSRSPIELGAEFVHGRPAALWSLIEEARLATYELGGAQVACASGSLDRPTEPPAHAYQVLEDMIAWHGEHAADADRSFTEYLEARGLSGEETRPAVSYVEGFNAADARRISLAALVAQQRAEDAVEGDRLFRIASGYSSLAAHLAATFCRAGGELRLSHPVERIRWRRRSVTIEARDPAGRPAELTAERLVLTVPLGVLKSGAIAFDPTPSVLLGEAARLEMGQVERVVLEWRRPVWKDPALLAAHPALAGALATLGFLFTPTEAPATWWTPYPDPTPLLTGWAGGPRADALGARLAADGRPDARRRHCLAALTRVLGPAAAPLEPALIACHHHDWRADPFARGAYSYVPVGALAVPARLATPLEDTLYLAGEHTHTAAQWGTVHAAIESGARAAAQILGSS